MRLILLVNGDLIQEDSSYSYPTKNVVIDMIILQSTRQQGFREASIDRFIAVSTDIFDLSKQTSMLSSVYNERLLESIQRFRDHYQQLAPSFPRLRVTFCYASKGAEVHPNVERKTKQLKNVVLSHFPECEFEFRFLGARDLVELARRSPQSTYRLPLSESPISSGQKVGFVCLVGLRDFYSFISDDNNEIRTQIFEANVRDYQGRTEVNDEIQSSLEMNTTEDFWWLNNGVSIVATKASLAGKTLTIEDPQIVNGLQTSREVYDYYKKLDQSDDVRTILVRVMVPEEGESRDRIIKATNSQNAVMIASLRSTDKIHRDIEEYLLPRGLFYDRRKNYYKNEGKSRNSIVSISYLAQSVMAIVLRRPDTARARPSSLLKTDVEYTRVFDSSYPIQLYYVCTEVLRKVESYLKKTDLNVVPKDRNNLRFYVAMYVVMGIGDPPKPINEIAEFDVEGIDQAVVKAALDYIQPKYEALGANDQAAKGSYLLKDILDGGVST